MELAMNRWMKISTGEKIPYENFIRFSWMGGGKFEVEYALYTPPYDEVLHYSVQVVRFEEEIEAKIYSNLDKNLELERLVGIAITKQLDYGVLLVGRNETEAEILLKSLGIRRENML